MLSHLIRPASGAAAGVVIVFALLLAIAAKGGLFGIPLAFIVTSWFFKYAYILFDHTVWGFAEPPALDIKMLNPLDEQRPLAQLIILGLIYAAVKLAGNSVGLCCGGDCRRCGRAPPPRFDSNSRLGEKHPQGRVPPRCGPHGSRSWPDVPHGVDRDRALHLRLRIGR